MIHDAFLKPHLNGANVLLVDKYGNQEPTDVMIDAIIEGAKAFDYDRIVAIGGGAVMDMSRPWRAARRSTRSSTICPISSARWVGLVLVPTTCGTDGEIAKLNVVLAGLLGCDVADVYHELERLIDRMLPKKALHEYGVTRENLLEFTDRAMATQARLMRNNYVSLDAARVRTIFEELY